MLVALACVARAERLPVKNYTTEEGLAHNRIGSILLDSTGFLWFCTADGLSRFDGSRFSSYSLEEGLPTTTVNFLLDTRGGAYWVATNGGGVARLNSIKGSRSQPRPVLQARFSAYAVSDDPGTNRVNILLQDREGIIWAGTDGGLFRFDEATG